jgi:hypothetical protein
MLTLDNVLIYTSSNGPGYTPGYAPGYEKIHLYKKTYTKNILNFLLTGSENWSVTWIYKFNNIHIY